MTALPPLLITAHFVSDQYSLFGFVSHHPISSTQIILAFQRYALSYAFCSSTH